MLHDRWCRIVSWLLFPLGLLTFLPRFAALLSFADISYHLGIGDINLGLIRENGIVSIASLSHVDRSECRVHFLT